MTAAGGRWLAKARDTFAFPGRPDSQRVLTAVGAATNHVGRFVEAAGGAAATRVRTFTELITQVAEPGLFMLFAYQPDDVMSSFAPLLDRGRQWSTLVEIYEAWVRLTRAGQVPGVSQRGQQTAVAYLLRTRWYLYAIAYESPSEDWLSPLERQRLGSEHAATVAARQARQEWLDILDHLDDHPLLARDINPVAEANHLISLRLDASGMVGAPNVDDQPGEPTPIDEDVWRHCVRAHLLPRFDLAGAWRVAHQLSPKRYWRATWVARVLFATAVVAVAADLTGLVRYGLLAGAAAAALGYAAVVVAAAGEPSASWPWLLRQPASVAIGLLVLTSLPADWWQGSADPEQWFAAASAAAMVLVAAGYLTVEAVNHGVERKGRRVSTVIGMGLLHTVLVTTIGLGVVLPAFADHGTELGQCWTAARCGADALPRWLIFFTATGWGFAAGVFTQILWDDQPFTAPLAHLRWRTGR